MRIGYYVSNLGRIKRTFSLRKGNKTVGVTRYLKAGSNGCYQVFSRGKRWYVHRLVAVAFVPIPTKYDGISIDKLHVDHANGIYDDNRAENLRWCTSSENANFPLHKQNISAGRRGKPSWKKGLFGVKHKNIMLIANGTCYFFENAKAAASATGVPLYNVYASAYNKRDTTNGMKFRYVQTYGRI